MTRTKYYFFSLVFLLSACAGEGFYGIGGPGNSEHSPAPTDVDTASTTTETTDGTVIPTIGTPPPPLCVLTPEALPMFYQFYRYVCPTLSEVRAGTKDFFDLLVKVSEFRALHEPIENPNAMNWGYQVLLTADTNYDCVVSTQEKQAFIDHLPQNESDFDQNGIVDFFDMLIGTSTMGQVPDVNDPAAELSCLEK